MQEKEMLINASRLGESQESDEVGVKRLDYGEANPRGSIKYSFDTSAIVRAWNVDYPVEVFPGLWASLRESFLSNDSIITDAAAIELRIEDEEGSFHYLLKTEPKVPIAHLNEEILAEAKVLREEFRHPQDQETRGIDDFDAQIIAHAKHHGFVVVSNEQQDTKPDEKWNYKIPTVCKQLEVDCILISEWLRRTGWRF